MCNYVAGYAGIKRDYPGHVMSWSPVAGYDRDVVDVQGFLRGMYKASKGTAYNPGAADGYFGNTTLQAVLHYQSLHTPLVVDVVDGIVGPQTWYGMQYHK